MNSEDRTIDWRDRDKDLEIFSWRLKQFDTVVHDVSMAEKLVCSTASPHDAVKLAEAGCPPRLIVEILV